MEEVITGPLNIKHLSTTRESIEPRRFIESSNYLFSLFLRSNASSTENSTNSDVEAQISTDRQSRDVTMTNPIHEDHVTSANVVHIPAPIFQIAKMFGLDKQSKELDLSIFNFRRERISDDKDKKDEIVIFEKQSTFSGAGSGVKKNMARLPCSYVSSPGSAAEDHCAREKYLETIILSMIVLFSSFLLVLWYFGYLSLAKCNPLSSCAQSEDTCEPMTSEIVNPDPLYNNTSDLELLVTHELSPFSNLISKMKNINIPVIDVSIGEPAASPPKEVIDALVCRIILLFMTNRFRFLPLKMASLDILVWRVVCN